jgi:hypothetical protein
MCKFTRPLPIVGVAFLFAFAVLVVLVGSTAVADVVVVDLTTFFRRFCRVEVGARIQAPSLSTVNYKSLNHAYSV